MSSISEIYVSRPDLIKFDPEGVWHQDFIEAFAELASSATEILILGGYYESRSLIEICSKVPRRRRKKCKISIAVGLESTSLVPRTWEDMRLVRKEIIALGFEKVKVAVVGCSPVHFHTKLFKITRTTWPVWFVGSSNPGSSRHELMVKIIGKHEALSAYVNAVFDVANIITTPPPDIKIENLRDFFLAGKLCHKPPIQRIFTLDVFRLTPEDREKLAGVFAGGAGVEHARPRTEGFGFSLRSALGEVESPVEGGEDDASPKIHYRRSCVDTAFGLWMPKVYAHDIEVRVRDEELAKLREFELLAERLADRSGKELVETAFDAYVASMKRFLVENVIEVRPIQSIDQSFARFLKSRTKTLMNKESRVRLARSMILTDMPDIWDEERARDAFEESFFDDVAYRSGSHGGPMGRVIRSLVDALDLAPGYSTEEIRAALAERLSLASWSDADWIE